MKSLLHRLGAPLAAVALLMSGAVVMVSGPTASAATSLQILATTTSVSATPSVVVSASLDDPSFTPQSTTLTATVTEAPLGGLLVTPTGPVTFTATDAHGATIALGSKTLGLCLLNLLPCTASLSSNAFYVDPLDATAGGTTWIVTASYAGDLVAKSSMGTTKVTAATGDTSTCQTNRSCFVSSTNGDGTAFVSLSIDCVSNCITTTTLRRNAAPTINAASTPPTQYSIFSGFGFPNMASCPGGNSALDPAGVSQNADMWFPPSVVSPTKPADITYELIGSTADAQAALPDPTSFCYAQTAEFTQANGTPAPFDATTNQYEGNPPACGSTPLFPCKYNENYVPGSPSTWEIMVLALIDPGAGKH